MHFYSSAMQILKLYDYVRLDSVTLFPCWLVSRHPECRFAEDQSVILGPSDYHRIVQESHVITPKMRQEASERTLQEKAEKLVSQQ